MTTVRLRPAAREDLFGIYTYSAELWGIEKAENYILGLNEIFMQITEEPYLGTKCDTIRRGYRRRLFGRHAIYYKITADFIDIVRILHQSQDPEIALG
jgi:toxin ParE1/3/4